MCILLTGGTGKTSIRLASQLLAASTPFLLASRSPQKAPSTYPHIKFDWLDPSTFLAPFEREQQIKAIYLILPQAHNATESVKAFIDLAIDRGVRRFVLLTGNRTECGKGDGGMVWKYLIEKELEWCVLRATWFMENFSQWQHYSTIKNEGKIYSACADGKVPFISAKDIAAVARCALTDSKPHNTHYRVLGPELLTHDQIAEKLTNGLGRKIEHVRLSPEQITQRWIDNGMPQQVANFMTNLEVLTAQGDEERESDAVEKVTGKKPLTFDDWVQENKRAWD